MIAATREYWTNDVGSSHGPVAQARIYQLLDYDARLTEPARVVGRFIFGWYHSDYSDALASVRHIVTVMEGRAPEGSRTLTRSAVHRALSLLIETGWVTRTFTGAGRGASRYVPAHSALELAAAGRFPTPLQHGNRGGESSVASHSTGTQLSHATGTQEPVASHPSGTKTPPPDPAKDGVTVGERIESAGPAAPPRRAPLGAVGAVTADDFDQLFDAYGFPRKRHEALQAFQELEPDANLLAAMVAKATQWRQAWAAQKKPDAPRMLLHTWIKRQEWKCDPPMGHLKPAKAKQQASPPVPANDDALGAVGPAAPTARKVTVRDTRLDKDEGSILLRIVFDQESGRSLERSIYLQHSRTDLQEEGRQEFSALCRAIGLDQTPEDSEELHGLDCTVTPGSGAWGYAAAA